MRIWGGVRSISSNIQHLDGISFTAPRWLASACTICIAVHPWISSMFLLRSSCPTSPVAPKLLSQATQWFPGGFSDPARAAGLESTAYEPPDGLDRGTELPQVLPWFDPLNPITQHQKWKESPALYQQFHQLALAAKAAASWS